jgi:hypothetical protein
MRLAKAFGILTHGNFPFAHLEKTLSIKFTVKYDSRKCSSLAFATDIRN